MFTSRMIHLTAVVLEKDRDTVSKVLLDHGSMEFVRMSSLSAGADKRISRVESSISAARLLENKRRIETFISSLSQNPLENVILNIEEMKTPDLDSIETGLDRISAETQEIRNRQNEIQKEINKLEDMQRQISMFGNLRVGLKQNSAYSFLKIEAGTVPVEFVDVLTTDLASFPSVNLNLQESGGRMLVLLISLKRDEQNISSILKKYAWTESDIPEQTGLSNEAAVSNIKKRLAMEKEKQQKINEDYRKSIEEKSDWFRETWCNITMNHLLTRIQSYFSRTQKTVFFTGWVPEENKEALESALINAMNGRCFLEWNKAEVVLAKNSEKLAVPVKLNNPGFLKPFEMLVTNYAIPEYKAIDPTPFVAVAYLLMFGLMFGDAGHGAVLALIGLLGPIIKKKLSDGVRKLFTLISYCGVSAVLFGVFFGSYFGRPWVKPLWFDYHGIISGHSEGGAVSSIYGILLITIYFGISVIALGLLINWVNLLRKKNWADLLFTKGGIIGGWMYAAGVYTGFKFVSSSYKELPPGTFLLINFGVPALVFLLKEPLVHLLKHRDHSSGQSDHPQKKVSILNAFMEWIVEMLEIFSGYLANTLSFMRVAGLGIAHVSLMLAFNEIALMTASNGKYTIISYVIYVAGNVLVIALEGLSAGIQALRLNYYEFFSKYFNGTGKAYAPITLKTRSKEG